MNRLSFSKHFSICASIAVLVLAVSAEQCIFGAPILTFNESTGGNGVNQNQSVGWQFDVLSPTTVTGLGWFDEGANGLGHSHTVGIWNPAGTLLQSALVPAGLVAPLDGQFRTIAIAPIVLSPGVGYIVGGENFDTSGDRLAFDVSQMVDPRIQYFDGTFSALGSGFVRPTSFAASITGIYGPSFSVPEPSGIVLAAFGFIGLAAWGWRRKR